MLAVPHASAQTCPPNIVVDRCAGGRFKAVAHLFIALDQIGSFKKDRAGELSRESMLFMEL
jgi:hypothetical protein